MTKRPVLPLLAVAVLALAACGGDDAGSDDTIDAPTDSMDGDAQLRAPTPIEVVGGGAAGDEPAAQAGLAEDAATSDMAIAPAPWMPEYVVGDDLPALPTDDTGYVFDADPEVSADTVERIAAALGLTGSAERRDDGFRGGWVVGPDDGSAPTLWVSEDALLSWNYSGPWPEDAAAGCAVSVDSDGNESAECDEPEPPAGVPTADEAEQRARELLAALDVDVSTVEFETFADEWFTNVSVSDTRDARGATMFWNFGFGAEGVLQFASGSLAEPQPVGPYPLIDLDTAIGRLSDGSSWFPGVGGPAVDLPAIAIAEAPPAEAGVEIEPEPEVDAEVDMREGAVEGGEPGSAGSVDVVPDDPPPADGETTPAEEPEPMPVEPEPLPVEPEPGVAPEPVVVTLVDVQADLWWAWDVDGAAWLLPAYRFIDTDGGWHTVPAVTDEFLIQVDPPVFDDPVPAPEPMPVEPEPAPEPLPEPAPEPVDPALAELGALVGLPLEEYVLAAETFGYEVRVVERDGEGLVVTDDFRQFRINVAVVTVDGVEQVVRAVTDDGTVIGEVTIEPVVDAPEPIDEPPGAAGPEVLLELADALPQPLDEFSERAASFGYSVRVVMIDGEPQAVTADYSETRINVAVEGAVVVEIDGIG